MRLYENVVIGGYLFDLGVRMAKLRPELPLISVNLLQQTPSDRLLGDVLLANASVCRLIEFKRAGKLTSKEMKKLTALRSGIENSKARTQYENLSREIHWYIEIQEPQVLGQKVVSQACPYLDFEARPNFISINQFAAAAAHEACQKSATNERRKFYDGYIKWICRFFAEIEARDRAANAEEGAKGGTSGVFMVAINDKAETYWMAVPSIEYAFMNKYELSQALGLQLEPDTPKYEQKIDRGYGMGFGFLTPLCIETAELMR